jgi:hypothetical protein
MVLPPPVEASALTAWLAPVSYAGVQEHAVLVHPVFQPSWDTQTNSPPVTQVLMSVWSGTTGVQNRAAGSQFAVGPPASPVISCAAHMGEMKSLNECPPSVDVYIVPLVYSPTMLFPLLGSVVTSKL